MVNQNSNVQTAAKQNEKPTEGLKREAVLPDNGNVLPGQVASGGGNTIIVEEHGGRPPVKAYSLLSEEEKKKLVPPGTILVEWYDENDPALPFNWSTGKLTIVAGLILSVPFPLYSVLASNL